MTESITIIIIIIITSYCWEHSHLLFMVNIEWHEAVFGCYVQDYYICWFHKHEDLKRVCHFHQPTSLLFGHKIWLIPYPYFVAAKQNDNNKWAPWEMTIIGQYFRIQEKIEIYENIKKCSTASHTRFHISKNSSQSLKKGFLPSAEIHIQTSKTKEFFAHK